MITLWEAQVEYIKWIEKYEALDVGLLIVERSHLQDLCS